MIQIMILESALTLYSLSHRLPTMGPKKSAATRNTAPLPVSRIIRTADSPALTDTPLPTIRPHACAKRRMSSVTASARKAVHAPRPAQVPIRRSDGSAAALAQKGDRNGRPVACMAVAPIHGNVSTLLVILKAVRVYLTHLSRSACLFLV